MEVVILRSGAHQWMIPGVFNSLLELDFRKFPFDHVTPTIEVAWLDSELFVNVSQTDIFSLADHWPSSPVFIQDSAVWRFREPKMAITQSSGTLMKSYSITNVYFYLERRQEYYIMTMFVPTEILMALQLATFIMPPSAIERATYSITVNLAFAVSQQVVNNQLPKTSQTIYLFFYIVVYLVIGALITIHTIILTTFWQNSDWVHNKRIILKHKVAMGRVVDLIVCSFMILLVMLDNAWYYSLVTSDL